MVKGKPWESMASRGLEGRLGLSKMTGEDLTIQHNAAMADEDKPDFVVPTGLHGRSRSEAARHRHRMHAVDKAPWQHMELCIHQRAQEGKEKDAEMRQEWRQHMHDVQKEHKEVHKRSRREGGMTWRSSEWRVQDAENKEKRTATMAEAFRREAEDQAQNKRDLHARAQQRDPINTKRIVDESKAHDDPDRVTHRPINTYPSVPLHQRTQAGTTNIRKDTNQYFKQLKVTKIFDAVPGASLAQVEEALRGAEGNADAAIAALLLDPILAASRKTQDVPKDDWDERIDKKYDQGRRNMAKAHNKFLEESDQRDEMLEMRLEHRMWELREHNFNVNQYKRDNSAARKEELDAVREKHKQEKRELIELHKKLSTKNRKPGCSKFFPSRFAGYIPVVNSTPRGKNAEHRMKAVEEEGHVERILGSYGETTRSKRNSVLMHATPRGLGLTNYGVLPGEQARGSTPGGLSH